MENINLLKAGEHVEPDISQKSDPLKWLDKGEIGDWNLIQSKRNLSLKVRERKESRTPIIRRKIRSFLSC